MGKENQKESLLGRLVLGSLTTLLNAFAQLHKIIIVDIIFKLEEKIYPSSPFDYKGFKLEKKIVYGGPTLEELIKQRGGSTTEELMKRYGDIAEIEYPKDFDSLLGKVKNASPDEYLFLRRIEYEAQNMYLKYSNSFFERIKDAFIEEANSRGWMAKLETGHHFPFDPIKVKTLKGRRSMIVHVSSGTEVLSVSIERGGFRRGLILDEQIISYLNGFCKRLYSKPYCVKSGPYEELEALVIIPTLEPLQPQLQAPSPSQ